MAGPQVIASAFRAMQEGYHQGETTGDVTMLPGTFVVDQQGVIQYAYYSKFAGDQPDLAKLFEMAQRIGE
jgi:hypothetical protein